jgi:hypothetical protein
MGPWSHWSETGKLYFSGFEALAAGLKQMVCCAATGSPSSKRSVKLFFQSFILFFSTEKETFVRTGLENLIYYLGTFKKRIFAKSLILLKTVWYFDILAISSIAWYFCKQFVIFRNAFETVAMVLFDVMTMNSLSAINNTYTVHHVHLKGTNCDSFFLNYFSFLREPLSSVLLFWNSWSQKLKLKDAMLGS